MITLSRYNAKNNRAYLAHSNGSRCTFFPIRPLLPPQIRLQCHTPDLPYNSSRSYTIYCITRYIWKCPLDTMINGDRPLHCSAQYRYILANGPPSVTFGALVRAVKGRLIYTIISPF